ncbi:MAG TPA: tripartite tricarboxylate transporter substrate binding protein [Ramlibacter sp.]|uniref:tripartite tricarboxylate transporter substrate binding protein n=1 Tax=Ramlibacter sp. TaxID=1917967 RepID=UPI002ED57649
MNSLPFTRRACIAAALALAAGALHAQAAYPDKPVRIVVPSSPGGSADAVARMVGERLSKTLGQQFVVDNKGGGGNIATEIVAKAAPDGYTLLLTGNNHTVNVSLFAKAPYKLEDFAPVIELTRGPSVFVAANNAPFSGLKTLIAKAKAAPASIAYGSPGIGLPSHIAFELFQYENRIQLVHAPYKGSGPSLADAVAGQIPLVSSTLAAAMPHIKAGKVKALAVTSAQRWPSLPDVPTVAEVTGSKFTHLTWLGVLAPKGTPEPIVARLNAEMDKMLKDPDLRKTLETLGTDPVGGSPAAMGRMIQDEYAASRNLIQAAKLKAE